MSQSDIFAAAGRDDMLLPFQIDPFGLRGRLVRLGAALDTILGRHGYPDAVSELLAETTALAACLAGALKYEGIFSLQMKGSGPIRTMVADVTSAGGMRAYASFDAEAVAAAVAAGPLTVQRLLGGGYIAFTVDQGADTDRYQGIVELSGATLAECAHAYFRQSEQLETGIKVAVARDPDRGWRAGAIMLQRMPFEGGTPLPPGYGVEDYEDSWRSAMVMMSSATADELAGDALAPDRLLYRLFHESGIRAYPAHPLAAECRCSDARVESVLRSLSAEELRDMTVDGRVTVTCEFCKNHWDYDELALARLRRRAAD